MRFDGLMCNYIRFSYEGFSASSFWSIMVGIEMKRAFDIYLASISKYVQELYDSQTCMDRLVNERASL